MFVTEGVCVHNACVWKTALTPNDGSFLSVQAGTVTVMEAILCASVLWPATTQKGIVGPLTGNKTASGGTEQFHHYTCVCILEVLEEISL